MARNDVDFLNVATARAAVATGSADAVSHCLPLLSDFESLSAVVADPRFATLGVERAEWLLAHDQQHDRDTRDSWYTVITTAARTPGQAPQSHLRVLDAVDKYGRWHAVLRHSNDVELIHAVHRWTIARGITPAAVINEYAGLYEHHQRIARGTSSWPDPRNTVHISENVLTRTQHVIAPRHILDLCAEWLDAAGFAGGPGTVENLLLRHADPRHVLPDADVARDQHYLVQAFTSIAAVAGQWWATSLSDLAAERLLPFSMQAQMARLPLPASFRTRSFRLAEAYLLHAGTWIDANLSTVRQDRTNEADWVAVFAENIQDAGDAFCTSAPWVDVDERTAAVAAVRSALVSATDVLLEDYEVRQINDRLDALTTYAPSGTDWWASADEDVLSVLDRFCFRPPTLDEAATVLNRDDVSAAVRVSIATWALAGLSRPPHRLDGDLDDLRTILLTALQDPTEATRPHGGAQEHHSLRPRHQAQWIGWWAARSGDAEVLAAFAHQHHVGALLLDVCTDEMYLQILEVQRAGNGLSRETLRRLRPEQYSNLTVPTVLEAVGYVDGLDGWVTEQLAHLATTDPGSLSEFLTYRSNERLTFGDVTSVLAAISA